MRSSEAKAFPRARWALAAAVAGGLGGLVRRRRAAKDPPAPEPAPPPLTTQSSPGQIANLQEAYGADMGPLEDDGGGSISRNGGGARAR